MAFDSNLLSLSELFPSALIVCIKATLLLTLVAIVALILRRQSAALRHLLWTFAVAGIVALPVLTVASPLQLRVLPAATPRGESAAQSSVRDPGDAAAVNDVAGDAGNAGNATGDGMQSPNAAADPALDSGLFLNDDRRDAAGLLLTVWLLGALLLLIRFGIAVVAVRRLVRRAAPVTDSAWIALARRSGGAQGARAPVDIRVSEDVAMPFAFGLFAPTIVLPSSSAEWTLERREAVLMHEFAHISRGDLAMNTLSHLARAIYWFHPLAWLASYRLRVEGERACDDAVLRGGARPSDYAEHLLSIVRTVGKTVPSTALAMARRSDFEGRLLAILEPGLPRETLTRWRAVAIAVLFLVAILPLAAA